MNNHELPFPIKTIVLDSEQPSRPGIKPVFCFKTGLHSDAAAAFLIQFCTEFGSSFGGLTYSRNFIKNLGLERFLEPEVKWQFSVRKDSHISVMKNGGVSDDPSEAVFFDQNHEVCMETAESLVMVVPPMSRNSWFKLHLADAIQDLIELVVEYERLIDRLSRLNYGNEGVAEFESVQVCLTSSGKRKLDNGLRLSYEDFRFMDKTDKKWFFSASPKNPFKNLTIKNRTFKMKDLEGLQFLGTGFSAREAFLFSLLLLGMDKRRAMRLYKFSEAEIDEFMGTEADPLSQNVYAARLEELKKKKDKLKTDEASEVKQFLKQAEDEFKKLQKCLAIKFKILHDKKQAELDEFFEKTVKESEVEYAFNRSLKVPEVKVGCEQMTEKDLIKLAMLEENENQC